MTTTPRCAACNQPLDVGKRKFLISGTEVLHPACARAGRQTEAWRLRTELAATQQALAKAEAETRRASSFAASARDLASEAQSRVREMYNGAAAQKREIDRLANENAQYLNEMREARALYEAERSMHTTTTAELDRLKAERLASDATTEETPVDDSAVRFSLLELH